MSSPFRTLSRLPVVGLVLGCAGFLKLVSGHRPPSNQIDDEVQRLLSPRMSLLLSFSEIGIALLDLVFKKRQASAVLGMLIFGVGCSVISYPLATGRRAKCECFGAFSNRELGLRDVGRNVALFALATNQAELFRSRGVVKTLSRLRIWVLSALLMLQTLALFFLLLKVAILRKASQLGPSSRLIGPGMMVPHFEVIREDEVSEDVVAEALRATESPLALLFGSPHCDTCVTLRSQFAAYVSEMDGKDPRASFIWVNTGNSNSGELLLQGDVVDSRQEFAATELGRRIYNDRFGVIAAAFGLMTSPAMIVIGADGLVAEKPYVGRAAIKRWESWAAMHSQPS